MTIPTLIDAIKALCLINHPNAGIQILGKADTLTDLSCLTLSDGNDPSFTWKYVETKKEALEAEWEAQEYARKRLAEYPSIESLVVALYDTDDKSAIEAKRAAVKAKYPKP